MLRGHKFHFISSRRKGARVVAKRRDGWSVTGTGTIATEHMVRAIRSAGHQLLWVVSRSSDYARAFSDDMDIPNRSTDVRKALKDDAVGYVYVSAQRERRRHYIKHALASSKDILTDGPIASTSRIAGELVAAARAAHVNLTINQPFRASAIHQTMRRLCLEGEIGPLRSLVIIRSAPTQPRPQRRTDEEEKAGNILLDVSVDSIDLSRFLSGREPLRSTALASPVHEGTQQISYAVEMSGGLLFQSYESLGVPDFESLVMIAGDHGTLVAHGTLNAKANGTLVRRTGAKNEHVPVRERDPFHATVEEVIASASRPSSWLCTGHDNLVALRTAECIAASIKKSRLITVASRTSPEREQS